MLAVGGFHTAFPVQAGRGLEGSLVAGNRGPGLEEDSHRTYMRFRVKTSNTTP